MFVSPYTRTYSDDSFLVAGILENRFAYDYAPESCGLFARRFRTYGVLG